ncbi:MAG: hypothetical protein NY202_01140 [Mollicutes bacterium UO1]
MVNIKNRKELISNQSDFNKSRETREETIKRLSDPLIMNEGITLYRRMLVSWRKARMIFVKV